MIARGGSRAAATPKMECFVIIVNDLKHSILDVAAALDPPLIATSIMKELNAVLLKRDSNTGAFLWILRNSKNTYFEEHLRMATSEQIFI